MAEVGDELLDQRLLLGSNFGGVSSSGAEGRLPRHGRLGHVGDHVVVGVGRRGGDLLQVDVERLFRRRQVRVRPPVAAAVEDGLHPSEPPKIDESPG